MRIVLMLLLTLFTSISVAKVETFTLDNGLKIIVKEDHRAPVVVSMIWYHVGSADEYGGITGVSHALEHLMFKGTTKYPLGVFSKTIAALGGQENAFTNTDYTAYFEKLAAPHLKTSFALEADRMQHLLFDNDEFAKEIKVIQEERRLRTDDNPQALALERFFAAAHLATPYHHPTIGWMSDLEQMNVSDLKHWYKRFYAPGNATLVVVGDVKPKAVKKLAQTYFGELPKIAPPQRKQQIEPPALGKKKVTVYAQAKIPMLILGYNVPSVPNVSNIDIKTPYALELIAGLLNAGESGRLSKNLIRGEQIASSADVFYNLYARYQTQFILFGTPSQNHSINNLRNAFFRQIKLLKETPVSNKELTRVKTQIIAQKTFEKDSLFGQAMELGLLESVGLGWQTANQYIERIKAITPEDIQHVAQRYFITNSLTEAELIPETGSS